jgi:hypothetical protein
MTNRRPSRLLIKRPSRAAVDREEYAGLYWADLVNRAGVGLYGSSLQRCGPELVCEALALRGMLLRVDRGDRDERGYWITEAGRKALEGAMMD